MTVSKFASICTMVGAAGGRPGRPGTPGAGGRTARPWSSPLTPAVRGARAGGERLDGGGQGARGLAAPGEGEAADEPERCDGDQRGAPVLDVAGGGHRPPAPRGSTAQVFPRRRGRAAGSARGVGARAGARPRWVRRWKGAERHASFPSGERGAGRWPWARVGVCPREDRVSFLPRRGRKSSADFLTAPRVRPSPPPVAQGKGVCMKVETY